MKSDDDKSLAFNNFTDPCPELTKKQLQTMKGFESCPLVLFLRLVYVTQNKPSERSSGNTSGGAAEFIQKSHRKKHDGRRWGIEGPS